MRNFRADLTQALRTAWLVASLAVLSTLVAPFALGREHLARLLPPCEWKVKYHRECPFCGMTTSFMDISDGQFGNAQRANRAGIPMYFAFLSNELGALAFLRRKRSTACKP